MRGKRATKDTVSLRAYPETLRQLQILAAMMGGIPADVLEEAVPAFFAKKTKSLLKEYGTAEPEPENK